jgi:outer membrane immunogenic protein
MRHKVLELIVIACIAAVASAANAADLPVKAPPRQAVAPFSWTGVYVGGHAGYGWADKDWVDPAGPPFNAGSHTATGWLAGFQAGANYQFTNWVIGVEGQYSWARFRGDHISLVDPADTLSTKVRRIATFAGRFGYAFDRTLIYAKGGGAWTHDDHTKIDLGVLEGIGHANRSGWMAGAGVEYAFNGPWSAKLEYNYMDFGTRRVTLFDPAGGPPDFFDIRQRIHTIAAGVNYRFWTGGSVIANRY